MNQSLPKIAMIGECMIELNGTPFGSLTQTFGGDTLNTAVYLSRLLPRADVYYVTGMGTDMISQSMIEAWQQEGLRQEFIVRFHDKQPGLYWIFVDDKGERTFSYWRQYSAASQWLDHPEADEVLHQLLSIDWIYLSGISLAILSPAHRQKLLSWLKIYQQQGGKIAFDSNYRPRLWVDKQETQYIHQTIMQLADVLLLTADDEMALWQLTANDVWQHYQAYQNKVVILKQGRDGAFIQHESGWAHVPTQAVNQLVDTTAAGDSFNAGFLAAVLQQRPLQEACHWGNQLAGTVIQHKGAIIPLGAMPQLD